MYYILNQKIALRSWWLVPYAYYIKNRREAYGLNKEEYDFLSCCDGVTDLPENELSEILCSKNLCQPISRGEKSLTEWQKPMICNNRYMPSMNWMITGRCNYNCMHCFNAVDNAPIQSEFTFDEAVALLDEAQKCGINGLTITGGEPMMHGKFVDILREIYKRGMYVFEINTNGYFLNQNILDAMKQIGCHPIMKISFDGIGFHDIMRGIRGAEEDALRAIKICIDNGFDVKVQMQINLLNKDLILESLLKLESMGVYRTRVIRTTEGPRWRKNAAGKSMTIEEYYDESIRISKEYMKKSKGTMSVKFWQFLAILPDEKGYAYYNICKNGEDFDYTVPLCKGNRGMISVSSDGNVYPCMQMSGLERSLGEEFGNVKTDGLQKILQNSNYMNEICATIRDLTEVNDECGNCPYLKDCGGGCRALAIAFGGGLRMCDKSKCIFFKADYPKKIREALPEYLNLSKN